MLLLVSKGKWLIRLLWFGFGLDPLVLVEGKLRTSTTKCTKGTFARSGAFLRAPRFESGRRPLAAQPGETKLDPESLRRRRAQGGAGRFLTRNAALIFFVFHTFLDRTGYTTCPPKQTPSVLPIRLFPLSKGCLRARGVRHGLRFTRRLWESKSENPISLACFRGSWPWEVSQASWEDLSV